MPKEVQVELDGEEKITVKLKKLSYRKFKRISRLLFPGTVNLSNPKASQQEIPYEKLNEYNEELIKESIDEPKTLITGIDSLTKESFDNLLKAVLELNGLSQAEVKNLD
jgi:DNA replicative helicase MCM subunit Mcm2 (Cdc46/Mcm family)